MKKHASDARENVEMESQEKMSRWKRKRLLRGGNARKNIEVRWEYKGLLLAGHEVHALAWLEATSSRWMELAGLEEGKSASGSEAQERVGL